jgi:putative transposase
VGARRGDLRIMTMGWHTVMKFMRPSSVEDYDAPRDCRYLLHDRDTKFTRLFRANLISGGVEPLALPARSPNLNSYAERWVRLVKEECLSKVILFGETRCGAR